MYSLLSRERCKQAETPGIHLPHMLQAKRGGTSQPSALRQKVDLHLLENTPHGCSIQKSSMFALEHHPTELLLPAPGSAYSNSQLTAWLSPLLLHIVNVFASPFNQQPPLSTLLQLLSPLPSTPVQDILPSKKTQNSHGGKPRQWMLFCSCSQS